MRLQRDRLEALAGASFTNVVTRGAVSDGLTNHMRFAYDHARGSPLTAQNMAAAYPNQAKTPFGPAYRFSHLTDGLGLTDAAEHDLNAASAKMTAITVGFGRQSLGALNGCYSWSIAPTGFSFRLNENSSGFLGLQSGSSTHYTSGVPNPSAEGKLWAAGFTMTRGSAIRFSAAGISEDYGAWNYTDVGGYPNRFCLGGFRQATEFAAGSSVQLVTLLKGGAEIADDALEFLCDDPRVILSCFTPGSTKSYFLPSAAGGASYDETAAPSASASLNTSASIEADVSAFLASTAILATVGNLTLEEAATLAATAAVTSTGGALFEETAALAATSGFAGALNVTFVGSATFPASAGVAAGTGVDFAPRAVLSGVASLALSAAGSTYTTSVNLDAIAASSASGAGGGATADVASLGAVATISASARLRWEPATGVVMEWTEAPTVSDIWNTRGPAG